MTEGKKPVVYTYEERMAIQTIRKSMLKKPEIIEAILKDAPLAMAERLLYQARDELENLHRVSQAFVAAASALAKKQKDQPN